MPLPLGCDARKSGATKIATLVSDSLELHIPYIVVERSCAEGIEFIPPDPSIENFDILHPLLEALLQEKRTWKFSELKSGVMKYVQPKGVIFPRGVDRKEWCRMNAYNLKKIFIKLNRKTRACSTMARTPHFLQRLIERAKEKSPKQGKHHHIQKRPRETSPCRNILPLPPVGVSPQESMVTRSQPRGSDSCKVPGSRCVGGGSETPTVPGSRAVGGCGSSCSVTYWDTAQGLAVTVDSLGDAGPATSSSAAPSADPFPIAVCAQRVLDSQPPNSKMT